MSDDDEQGNPIPKAPGVQAAPQITLAEAEALAAQFRASLGLPPLMSQPVVLDQHPPLVRESEDQQKIVGAMRRVRIMLQPHDDIPPTGLFLGHNGASYLLKTGVWVDVPIPILEILDNAVKMIPDVDPLTRRVVGWRPSLRFSYNVAPGAGDRGYREAA